MEFDLTTKDGNNQAAKWLRSNKGAVATSLAGAFFARTLLTSPVGLVGFAAYKLGKAALPSGDANVNQAKAAENLVATGKRNGVSKMTVTLNHEAGLHFRSNVEGAKIKTGIGSNEKMHMDIEYK